MREPYTRLYCHFVWSTWDRLPLINPAHEARLHGAIRSKLAEHRCVAIAIGGMEDHIHVLCRFPPTIGLAFLVQQIKGASSHFMNHLLTPEIPFKWQGSYGAFTVSKSDVELVREYIFNQKAHHAGDDLWPELEQTWLPYSAPARAQSAADEE